MSSEQSVLVVGCGGHARFVLGLIGSSSFSALGLIDLKNKYDESEIIMGVPVTGSLDSLIKQFQQGQRRLVLGIGDNDLRKEIYLRLDRHGYIFPNLIHPTAVIDPTVTIGVGNVIGPNAIIGAEVKIGNNNIVNSGAVIEHQSVIGNHSHVAPSATLCGCVQVGDRVFLGARSVVIDKLTVPVGTTLGAGGVLVDSPIKGNSVFVGCPAKQVRE